MLLFYNHSSKLLLLLMYRILKQIGHLSDKNDSLNLIYRFLWAKRPTQLICLNLLLFQLGFNVLVHLGI